MEQMRNMSSVARARQWLSLVDTTDSRHGLLQSVQLFILVFLVVTTLIIATGLPVDVTIHDKRFADAVASVLLIGCLCLHMISALGRGAYTGIDAVLDAAIACLAYLLVRSPILGNAPFYLLITAIAYILPAQAMTSYVGLLIAANLIATLGLQYLSPAGVTLYTEQGLTETWRFFLINLVGFPYFAFFIRALTRLLKKGEEDTATLDQVSQSLEEHQQHLMTAEKLAALGRMTGSITHEMNNNLVAILNSLELIQGELALKRTVMQRANLTPEEQGRLIANVQRWTDMGHRAAQHTADFIRSMRAQHHPMTETTEVEFSLARLMEDVAQIMRLQCTKRGCTLTVLIDEPQAMLFGEPSKYTQILTNLVRNAIESYSSAPAGQERPIWMTLNRRGDDYIVEVMDHGCGIPQEDLSRVFDYLFTTKGASQGTGFGLSIVREIVTEHFGGTVDVSSQVGHGTVFTLVFPTHPLDIERELAIL